MTNDKRIIKAGLLSSLITGLLIIGGITLYDKNIYYCDNTKIVMECASLESYYGLNNGKCINSKVGNKLCKNGWVVIDDEIQIETTNDGAQQWLCSSKGCTEK